MHPLQQSFTANWATGGNSSIPLKELLSSVAGNILHLSGINIELSLNITPHESADTPGSVLCRVMDRFILRDINGEEIINLKGEDFRTLIKGATGWRYPDPTALTPGGGAETPVVSLYIPFHGGRRGVLGYRKHCDLVQPIDRFRDTTLQIQWLLAGGLTGEPTINSCVARISFESVALPYLKQGADIRYGFIDLADAQVIDIPQLGRAFHTVLISNPDKAHNDYTQIHVQELNFLNNVRPNDLIRCWNRASALDSTEQENPLIGEFVPIVFQGASLYGVQGLMSFGGGELNIQATNTNQSDQHVTKLEVHSSDALNRALARRRGTVYEVAKSARAGFSDKNQASMAASNPERAARFSEVVGTKLSRG